MITVVSALIGALWGYCYATGHVVIMNWLFIAGLVVSGLGIVKSIKKAPK